MYVLCEAPTRKEAANVFRQFQGIPYHNGLLNTSSASIVFVSVAFDFVVWKVVSPDYCSVRLYNR